ncbi:helix-turn-helix transcriptional regulator [uncultured Methylophaga sp.]|uniref:S24 family peptidase n=1 Tax=uncultured Methylophaga sp. TaxID=285271 RepID=UPI0030F995C2
MKDRIEQRMSELGLGKQAVYDLLSKHLKAAGLSSVSQPAFSKVITGKTKNPWFIAPLARVLQCDPDLLHYGIKPQSNATFEAGVDSWEAGTPLGEDEIELPFYSEVQLAAGNGFVCDEERITKKLRFSKETLRKSGVDISHAVCVKVEGLSMLPVLPSGSTVGIDASKKTIHDGDMYAINHKGELRVKLLYNMPGSGVRVRSFNRDEFPDEHYSNIDEAEIHVIGRVFWYSVLC